MLREAKERVYHVMATRKRPGGAVDSGSKHRPCCFTSTEARLLIRAGGGGGGGAGGGERKRTRE